MTLLLSCKKCNEHKPSAEFEARANSSTGFRHSCRDCKRQKTTKRPRLVLNNRLNVPCGHKRCTRCRTVRPADPKHFGVRRSGAVDSWCRECMRAIAKAAQAKKRSDPISRETVRAANLTYSRSEKGRERRRLRSAVDNNLRRQRRIAAGWNWSPEQWMACKIFWSHRCSYCASDATNLEQDHFIPLSHKDCPGTVPSNMLPAFQRCNRSKGNRAPSAWCTQAQLYEIAFYFAGIEQHEQDKPQIEVAA